MNKKVCSTMESSARRSAQMGINMNINSSFSKWIYRFERHYNKENTGKSKYLIIKRESSSPLGLFAYYITNVAWIEYALRKGFVPVIDMQNFQNTYQKEDDIGRVNSWEYYFKQPAEVGVKEALSSKRARYVWSDIPDFHPNESLDFLMHKEIIEYYREIARKYVPFQDNVKKYLEEVSGQVLGSENERVLGVLARGTDYTNLKPYGHPVQPDTNQLMEKIDYYKDKYKCSKIYVATEDASVLEILKKKYKENLCYNNQKRIENTQTFLNYNKEFTQMEPYKRGLEYLASIYLLSRCTGLIAGRTSGTVGAVLLAESYEFQYIFSEGRYGVEEDILCHKV